MDILRRRVEATVDDLTQSLDLAPATIRRHLDILQRDGYITVRPVRRETGRPHYAFSLTEAGEDLFPQHYIRITNRLIDEIVSLDPAETAGKSGQDLAGLIFDTVEKDDGFLLLGRGCPCRRVADSHPAMCSYDNQLLAKLLDTQVEPTSSQVEDGESYCAYFVKKEPAQVLSG